ncbi:MAG: ABC transporter permease [Candidatus Acidiferrales bacterium]|jgi:putative ABC transport system permease protein
MQTLLQDLRYGIRMLAKTPGVVVLIILTLSLGIGGSTLLFNMVRQWILHPVSFPQADQLTVAWELDTKKGWMGEASAPDFADWRDQNTVFENLSAWTTSNFNLTGKERPERILGARVSSNFFQTLGAQPTIGRAFRPDEDKPGRNRLAILSYGLWHDRFNADPDEPGKTITLNGDSYTVVGVMPEDFHFTLMGRANIWVPLAFTEQERADRVDGWLNVVGRLKPGVTLAQAQQAMDPIAKSLEKLYPATNTNSGIFLNSLRHEIGKHVGDQGIYMSFCIGICILLIACANVAGILLARSLSRQKEMALRISLGANRFRIVRQLLTENVWLFVVAAGLGVVLAKWGGEWITNLIPFQNRGYLPNYGRLYVDFPTLAYSVGIALFSSLAFGLTPALHSSKPDLTGMLKDAGGSASISLRGRRMRKVLVLLEVSLALTSLVPAGLMIEWLKNINNIDLGFHSDHVLTARITLPDTAYSDPHQVASFYNRLLDRIQALPQVTSTGASQYIPFGDEYNSAEMLFEGRPAPDLGNYPGTAITAATPGYASVLGLQTIRGRFISDQDGPDSPSVIVINQTLADRYFPHQDPIGQRIQLGRDSTTMRTVVGIVKNVRLDTDFNRPPASESYVPFSQSPSRSMVILLRTSGDPITLAAGLRQAVTSLDQNQPVSQVVSLNQLISDQEAPIRIFTGFTNFFGVLALFLAAIGIYGTMAYIVEGRTKEMGIRVALGASPRDVMRLVLTHSVRITFVGILLGLAGALALARLIAGMLVGVNAADPRVYFSAAVVLGAAILLASYLPARRAMRVDPMVALRYE